MEEAAGHAATPQVLTPEQEGKLLAEWVRSTLKALRDEHGGEYGIGVTLDRDLAAWRLDGTGQAIVSADHEELGRWLKADSDARSGQPALGHLQWNWGDAYEITFGGDGWHALRRDGAGGPIGAASAGELRQRILGDYMALSVPRACDPGERL